MCGHREPQNEFDMWDYVRREVTEETGDIWEFYIWEKRVRDYVVSMLEFHEYKAINSDSRKTIYVEVK